MFPNNVQCNTLQGHSTAAHGLKRGVQLWLMIRFHGFGPIFTVGVGHVQVTAGSGKMELLETCVAVDYCVLRFYVIQPTPRTVTGNRDTQASSTTTSCHSVR